MSNYPIRPLRYDRNDQGGGARHIDARAPMAAPTGDALTGAHDWTAFNRAFSPNVGPPRQVTPASSAEWMPPDSQRPAQVTRSTTPNASSVVAPPRTAGSGAAAPSLAADKAFYAPHDPVTSSPAAGKLDVNSPAIQAALDRAADVPSAAENVAKAQQTGMPVQTPYGSIGSDWQQQVMAKHPAIGIKGSQANTDFVKAYGDAKAAGGTVDPHAIAQSVMDNITKPATDPRAQPKGVAAITPDIKAPTPINGPQAPVMFAGSNVGAADWANTQPTPAASPAIARAAAIHQGLVTAGQNLAGAGRNLVSNVSDAVKGGASDFWNPVKTLFAGPDNPSNPSSPASGAAPVSSTPNAANIASAPAALDDATRFPLTAPGSNGSARLSMGPDVSDWHTPSTSLAMPDDDEMKRRAQAGSSNGFTGL
jgi:hypothetical protein